MTFESLFVDPRGRTPRGQHIPALLVLLAVAGFYAFVVTGRTAEWCVVVLTYPFIVLHARRLHDMGMPAWPLALPAIMLLGMAWLRLYDPDAAVVLPATIAAMAVAAATVLLGLIGKGQSEANRFGAPVAA